MIRKKFIAILVVVLLGGAVAVGWTSTALAEEISYSFEVTLKQRFGNLKVGDTLTGSWTVDTTIVMPDLVILTNFSFFVVTSFQVVDPQNGGTWRDVFSDPGGGAAIIGNDIESFLIEHGHGRLKHTCPEDSMCDAYVVGFDGEHSEVSGTFAGVTSITDPLDKAGGLALADFGFGFVFEGDPDVFPTPEPTCGPGGCRPTSPAHPTGDEFFSEMLLFTGGVFKDPPECPTPPEDPLPPAECAELLEEAIDTFATIDLVSASLTPSISPSLVLLDIKPRLCPNLLNVNSGGVLPAAILGTFDFDVTQVDIASVYLEGVNPLRSAIADVATPFQSFGGLQDPPDPLDCTTEGPDGFDDLILKFKSQDVVSALGTPSDGDVLFLTLTGNLKDGSPIQFQDVVVIKKK
jgi:hypothetical protein